MSNGKSSELSESNYRRINIINWSLSLPLIALFAWPFYYLCTILFVNYYVNLLGSFLFSVPFAATIIHGHVTLALGTAHRMHYYNWLEENPMRYGFIFHPDFAKTRYRVLFFFVSLTILLVALIIS